MQISHHTSAFPVAPFPFGLATHQRGAYGTTRFWLRCAHAYEGNDILMLTIPKAQEEG
jgi:hypothetical protein